MEQMDRVQQRQVAYRPPPPALAPPSPPASHPPPEYYLHRYSQSPLPSPAAIIPSQ